MSQDHKELIELLAQVKPGQKICLKTNTIVEASSLSGSLYRSWYREDREDLMAKLEKLVVDIIKRGDEEVIETVLRGMDNLRETYQTDVLFCMKIREMIIKIHVKTGIPLPKRRKEVKTFWESLYSSIGSWTELFHVL